MIFRISIKDSDVNSSCSYGYPYKQKQYTLYDGYNTTKVQAMAWNDPSLYPYSEAMAQFTLVYTQWTICRSLHNLITNTKYRYKIRSHVICYTFLMILYCIYIQRYSVIYILSNYYFIVILFFDMISRISHYSSQIMTCIMFLLL